MDGISYNENFIDRPGELFEELKTRVAWDERMMARKTASFGVAYNYSQIQYPFQELLTSLEQLLVPLEQQLGFVPNNCLINYYLNGRSKMGFHSDQTDILLPGTGVAILSLGSTRVLRFRNIENRDHTIDYSLASGSLLCMTQGVQKHWQHAIPKSDSNEGRMSLTWRNIVQ